MIPYKRHTSCLALLGVSRLILLVCGHALYRVLIVLIVVSRIPDIPLYMDIQDKLLFLNQTGKGNKLQVGTTAVSRELKKYQTTCVYDWPEEPFEPIILLIYGIPTCHRIEENFNWNVTLHSGCWLSCDSWRRVGCVVGEEMLPAGFHLAQASTLLLIHDSTVLMQSNICRLRIPLTVVLRQSVVLMKPSL